MEFEEDVSSLSKKAQTERRQKELKEEILMRPEVQRIIQKQIQSWVENREAGDIASYRKWTEGQVFRSDFHEFMCWVVRGNVFGGFIMLTIFFNALLLAIESSVQSGSWGNFFTSCDMVFFTIYNVEFIWKLYCEPVLYWKNNYNLFDFVILLLSYFDFVELVGKISVLGDVTYVRVLRALRALRALRSISFIHALQVLLNALMKTLRSIVNLIVVLVLVMYVFAIMGYEFFQPNSIERELQLGEDWASLGHAMYTLWCYVTADGWVKFQSDLDDRGFSVARLFTVSFLFVGHFIFTNLFIGVIISNLDEAQEEEEMYKEVMKEALFTAKIDILKRTQKSHLEVKPSTTPKKAHWLAIKQRFDEIQAQQRHDDLVRMQHQSCNIYWLSTFLRTLKFQDMLKMQTQQLHFELANTLVELHEIQSSL